MEQVLKRIRSASARSGTSAYPSDSSMPFMRSESCSFIWHPKVVTWKRFTGLVRVSRGARPRGPVEGGGAGSSAGVVGGSRLPDDGDLDLPGVLELLLDLA